MGAGVVRLNGDAVKAAQGVLGRHGPVGPRVDVEVARD